LILSCKFEEGQRLKGDANSEEHSLDEPSNVDFSEVTPPDELNDPFSDESHPDLGPAPPMTPLSSPLPLFLPSLDPPESTFVESATSVLGDSCLDQTLEDIDIDRLEDHFEVKDFTLGPPLSFDFHISLDWPCFDPLPSPFRDVGLNFDHSDHSQWSSRSCSHIFVTPLTCASDFTYTHLFFVWAESFDKLKRALSCIAFMHFIWAILHVSNYFHFCEDGARMFDKLLRSLVGFDMSTSL